MSLPPITSGSMNILHNVESKDNIAPLRRVIYLSIIPRNTAF